MFLAGCNCFFRPERTLHFADMSFAKEEHTDTGLTNSSADGIRKCSIDDGFLEWQILAFRTAGFVKLQYQEPDNKQEYLHLKPSHRNPEHVRRAVRRTLRCHRSA